MNRSGWCKSGAKRTIQGILAGVLVLVGLHVAQIALHACSTPVFRYALERWRADPYQLVVFHGGALSDSEQALVNKIRERARDEKRPANLQVHLVDIETTLSAAARKFWEQHKSDTLPWSVLLYPPTSESREVLWKGQIAEKTADMLLDSPKRREVARRILKGDSVVWVLLESGDKTRDDEAATSLAKELDEIKDMLELPPGVGGDDGGDFADVEMIDPGMLNPNAMLSTLPLHIAFSVVRVARDDPKEKMLVDMLMGTEPDLREYTNEPMAFPVFGRGRALFALVGRGINERNLGAASQFLTGACSCEVKALCPGTDLLMAVNWEGVLADWVGVEEALPPLTGVLPEPANDDTYLNPAVTTQLYTPTQTDEIDTSSAIIRNTLLAIAAALLVVVAATFAFIGLLARGRA